MKETKELRTNKGITLIALVITIIVMLILVGVTITMAVNGGLFNYAGKATGETKNAIDAEQQLANGGITVGNTYYNSIDEYLATKNGGQSVETISKETSYVGYYADIDGDKVVDGVIYADLAIGGEGAWDFGHSYDSVAAEELRDYYVSGTYDGVFNEEGTPKEVLTAIGEGKDRFYVMALSDISASTYTWYASKSASEIEVTTSEKFGTGKTNTETMLTSWKADTDEEKNDNDIWNHLNENSRWFIPSLEELDAFFCSVELGPDNGIEEYGLMELYWSSSIWESSSVYYMDLLGFCFMGQGTDDAAYVRLSTTF